MLIKGLPGHVVEILDSHRIGLVVIWLNEKNLKSPDDYTYAGHKDNKEIFSFTKPEDALMFKLTWGGE
jgi:hypothetical protein